MDIGKQRDRRIVAEINCSWQLESWANRELAKDRFEVLAGIATNRISRTISLRRRRFINVHRTFSRRRFARQIMHFASMPCTRGIAMSSARALIHPSRILRRSPSIVPNFSFHSVPIPYPLTAERSKSRDIINRIIIPSFHLEFSHEFYPEHFGFF